MQTIARNIGGDALLLRGSPSPRFARSRLRAQSLLAALRGLLAGRGACAFACLRSSRRASSAPPWGLAFCRSAPTERRFKLREPSLRSGSRSGLKACVPTGFVFSPGFGAIGDFSKKNSVVFPPSLPLRIANIGISPCLLRFTRSFRFASSPRMAPSLLATLWGLAFCPHRKTFAKQRFYYEATTFSW